MSLIIDALKRTQQLRSNSPVGAPRLSYPSSGLTKRRDSKKLWIAVCAGLISLCVLLLIFFRPASSPLPTQTASAVASTEAKHSVAVPKKEEPTAGARDAGTALSGRLSSVPEAGRLSSEIPKAVLSVSNDRKLSPGDPPLSPANIGTASGKSPSRRPSNASVALIDRPSRPSGEKVPPSSKIPLKGIKEESTLKQTPKEETNPPERTVAERSIPPLPPVAQKEEPLPKSIAVEQEGEKNHKLASEVLNHFNSGIAFYNQKQFPKAIEAYQKAIELDSTYVEAYNNLGIVYQAVGDTKKAIGAYQKSIEINPRYEKGYNNLGLLFLLEGRHEEALEVFQKTLAMNPNHIGSHLNLGILFKQRGQWENAIQSYQRVLAIDPHHRETHYNIALLYEQLENWELAISHYRQFIQLSSKSYPELVVRVQKHLNALIEGRRSKTP